MSRLRGSCIVLLVIGAATFAQAAPKKSKSKTVASTATGETMAQAKLLLAQGNRKQALEQLEVVRAAAKSKADQREIAAKKILFAEQFLSSEAFQRYQEAKGLAEMERWDECSRELDGVNEKDQDNLLVLRLRADCELSARQYEPASRALKAVLTVVPGDVSASFSLVRVALAQKKALEANAILETIVTRTSYETEQLVILRARALEMQDKLAQAAELLKEDQERHLEHIEVIYELGSLYSRMQGHDWQSRKLLSLFITRCKRLKETELKARKFDRLLPEAQATLSAIDKKLGV